MFISLLIFLCLPLFTSSFSFNQSCDCYSCSSNSCISEETNGISFKVWFIDLANSNTNIAQIETNKQVSIRIYGSVKAETCGNSKCTSQLLIKSDMFQEQLCGTGNWDFDRTFYFTSPNESGLYDILISQDFDLRCQENDLTDTTPDMDIGVNLATLIVNTPTSSKSTTTSTETSYSTNQNQNNLTSLSTCNIQCPSMCHVVPYEYIVKHHDSSSGSSTNNLYRIMTYRNIAIGFAVGAAITFALSSHFLQKAVTVSNPWNLPPPSLTNTWIGSASITVGSSLLAQYWLRTICHDYLLFKLGTGFISIGILSTILMFCFQIKKKCFSSSNSSNSNDIMNDNTRTVNLLENSENMDNILSSSTTTTRTSSLSTRQSRYEQQTRHRSSRGAWIVQVSSAYVRIVSGCETLPGVPIEPSTVEGEGRDYGNGNHQILHESHDGHLLPATHSNDDNNNTIIHANALAIPEDEDTLRDNIPVISVISSNNIDVNDHNDDLQSANLNIPHAHAIAVFS
mmetsp:Transcript_3131/g.3890  ORF Transcript_3131/g.3890 Transcript_3131/m.3890 type:complete len:511 (-) Transcript_3131:231-1763(-)